MLTNTRPLTSPRSTRRSPPSTNASRAPTTSSRSTPRSSAKWLRVPAGTHAYGSPNSAATAATIACEPSPPAIASPSAPRSTAPRTSASRSSPAFSSIGSIPRSRASLASAKRSAFPPPERGLKNSTGRRGAGAPGRSTWTVESGTRRRQRHQQPHHHQQIDQRRPTHHNQRPPHRRARGQPRSAPPPARSPAGARRTRPTLPRSTRSPADPGRAGTRYRDCDSERDRGRPHHQREDRHQSPPHRIEPSRASMSTTRS